MYAPIGKAAYAPGSDYSVRVKLNAGASFQVKPRLQQRDGICPEREDISWRDMPGI